MSEWKLVLTKTPWGKEELRDTDQWWSRSLGCSRPGTPSPGPKASKQTDAELILVLDRVARRVFETGWV